MTMQIAVSDNGTNGQSGQRHVEARGASAAGSLLTPTGNAKHSLSTSNQRILTNDQLGPSIATTGDSADDALEQARHLSPSNFERLLTELTSFQKKASSPLALQLLLDHREPLAQSPPPHDDDETRNKEECAGSPGSPLRVGTAATVTSLGNGDRRSQTNGRPSTSPPSLTENTGSRNNKTKNNHNSQNINTSNENYNEDNDDQGGRCRLKPVIGLDKSGRNSSSDRTAGRGVYGTGHSAVDACAKGARIAVSTHHNVRAASSDTDESTLNNNNSHSRYTPISRNKNNICNDGSSKINGGKMPAGCDPARAGGRTVPVVCGCTGLQSSDEGCTKPHVAAVTVVPSASTRRADLSVDRTRAEAASRRQRRVIRHDGTTAGWPVAGCGGPQKPTADGWRIGKTAIVASNSDSNNGNSSAINNNSNGNKSGVSNGAGDLFTNGNMIMANDHRKRASGGRSDEEGSRDEAGDVDAMENGLAAAADGLTVDARPACEPLIKAGVRRAHAVKSTDPAAGGSAVSVSALLSAAAGEPTTLNHGSEPNCVFFDANGRLLNGIRIDDHNVRVQGTTSSGERVVGGASTATTTSGVRLLTMSGSPVSASEQRSLMAAAISQRRHVNNISAVHAAGSALASIMACGVGGEFREFSRSSLMQSQRPNSSKDRSVKASYLADEIQGHVGDRPLEQLLVMIHQNTSRSGNDDSGQPLNGPVCVQVSPGPGCDAGTAGVAQNSVEIGGKQVSVSNRNHKDSPSNNKPRSRAAAKSRNASGAPRGRLTAPPLETCNKAHSGTASASNRSSSSSSGSSSSSRRGTSSVPRPLSPQSERGGSPGPRTWHADTPWLSDPDRAEPEDWEKVTTRRMRKQRGKAVADSLMRQQQQHQQQQPQRGIDARIIHTSVGSSYAGVQRKGLVRVGMEKRTSVAQAASATTAVATRTLSEASAIASLSSMAAFPGPFASAPTTKKFNAHVQPLLSASSVATGPTSLSTGTLVVADDDFPPIGPPPSLAARASSASADSGFCVPHQSRLPSTALSMSDLFKGKKAGSAQQAGALPAFSGSMAVEEGERRSLVTAVTVTATTQALLAEPGDFAEGDAQSSTSSTESHVLNGCSHFEEHQQNCCSQQPRGKQHQQGRLVKDLPSVEKDLVANHGGDENGFMINSAISNNNPTKGEDTPAKPASSGMTLLRDDCIASSATADQASVASGVVLPDKSKGPTLRDQIGEPGFRTARLRHLSRQPLCFGNQPSFILSQDSGNMGLNSRNKDSCLFAVRDKDCSYNTGGRVGVVQEILEDEGDDCLSFGLDLATVRSLRGLKFAKHAEHEEQRLRKLFNYSACVQLLSDHWAQHKHFFYQQQQQQKKMQANALRRQQKCADLTLQRTIQNVPLSLPFRLEVQQSAHQLPSHPHVKIQQQRQQQQSASRQQQ